jgi:hypothetical protein
MAAGADTNYAGNPLPLPFASSPTSPLQLVACCSAACSPAVCPCCLSPCRCLPFAAEFAEAAVNSYIVCLNYSIRSLLNLGETDN